MPNIYFDNNSTTCVAPEVLHAILPYFCENYGNPSSLHRMGLEAERALKEARRTLANILRAKEYEIVFTSGGSESVNLALTGVARTLKQENRHFIASAVEHDAVLSTLKRLQSEGFDIDFVPTDQYGCVSKEKVCALIKPTTALVTMMHVNNELGTINEIAEIARAVKKQNKNILFFSDGAQAFAKMDINLEHIDLYSISGHKFHAPKGVGALFVRAKKILSPLILGGGQESNLRSGTENVPGIVGLGIAAKLAYANLQNNHNHLRELKTAFLQGLQSLPNIKLNSPTDALENTLNISFESIPSEVMMHALEEKNIYVSAGSACKGAKGKESSVLQAIGLPVKYARSAIRFSFSRYNTMEEIHYAVDAIQNIVFNLRSLIK